MSRNKNDYQAFKDGDDRAKGKKGGKEAGRATYVDVRPTAQDKEAIASIMSDSEPFFECLPNLLADSRIAIAIKADMRNRCWVLKVYDGGLDYKAATYYIFRHADFSKLIAFWFYVMSEKWQGILPPVDVEVEEFNW